jgi:hypothetical protein
VQEELSRVEGSEILDVDLQDIYPAQSSPSDTFKCGRRIHGLRDNLHANRCDLMRDAFLVWQLARHAIRRIFFTIEHDRFHCMNAAGGQYGSVEIKVAGPV